MEIKGRLHMKTTRLIAALMILSLTFAFFAPPALALGGREATASFLLPTTGQAMNGQIGNAKTKIMAGIEVASVTTIAILGFAAGGGILWAGVGPLLANHTWSAVDAYKNAKDKQDPVIQQQMQDAQRLIETSRQRRFEREQNYRSTVRERVRQAGEQAGT